MSSAKRIMVVEDEGLVAQDLKCTLEDLGYVVPAIASTGEAAISKAAEAGPDLVLMDIVLKGGMDGVTATEQISAAFDIPVVYVTAHASEETLQRAKISEPFGYVLKPFEERELHSVIEMALQKHRMQRALKEAHDALQQRVAERTAELAAANASLKQEIADHKLIEESLVERERRYRRLLAAVTSYTYSVHFQDGEPVSTEHGEGCISLTGYSPSDYASDPHLWITMVHLDDREMVARYVVKVLAGEELPPIEHRIVRKDGAVRWVRDTIVSHCDDDGQLVRYDGVVEDISERKQAEQALWDKEAQLLAAQKIQERLLPRSAPVLPGFDIAGALIPAEFAAGDYFDYLSMPDGSVGIVIGDVAGHGFAPALIMASTHVLLRSLTETHTDIAQILTLANSTLLRETEEQRFVTILFVRLDPKTGSLVYASAGHPAGYILDRTGEIKARLESTGLPLAILPDAKSAISGPVMLDPGDTVLLVTDGISEARSPDGDFFGTERTLEIVSANRDKNACEIVDRLFTAIREFSQRSTPVDDTTVVVIRVAK